MTYTVNRDRNGDASAIVSLANPDGSIVFLTRRAMRAKLLITEPGSRSEIHRKP